MKKVAGRVFDRDTTQAVSGAKILFIREDGYVRLSATSQSQGNYEITLPFGRYRTLVAHPTYVDPNHGRPGFLVVTPQSNSTSNFFIVTKPDYRWVHLDNSQTSDNDLHLGQFFSNLKLPLVGDFDGDGFDELCYTQNRTTSSGNDFWCIKAKPGTKTWQFLGGKSNNLAFDASNARNPAKFGVVADVDGDGQDEIILAIDSGGSLGNDFWAFKYKVSALSWQHMSSISGHRAHADFDCSAANLPAKFAIAGDFDGDGRDEIAVAIDSNNSTGNDFWVMQYTPQSKRWEHLSPIAGHPHKADLDCSGSSETAKFGVAGDFDGDGIDELVIAINAPNSRGNDFWAMKFDPSQQKWAHMSPIAGHPARADLDCSASNAKAIRCIATDINLDGKDELIVVSEHNGHSDIWVMSYNPDVKKWQHLTPIANHAVHADIDPSSEKLLIRDIQAADVDGDGVPELLILSNANASRGNDLWVMKFNVLLNKWEHLTPLPGHPGRASVDLSTSAKTVGHLISGRFGAGGLDQRDEFLTSIIDNGSIALANPNFWVKRYALSNRIRTVITCNLQLITESSNEQVGTRSSRRNNIAIECEIDTLVGSIQVVSMPALSDTFEIKSLNTDNTTTVKFKSSTVGNFNVLTGGITRLNMEFEVNHTFGLAKDSTLSLSVSTTGRLPAKHGGENGMPLNRNTSRIKLVGNGQYHDGFLADDLAFAVIEGVFRDLPA